MQISGYADRLGGLPGTLVLNNVFSTPVAVSATSRFMKMENAWGRSTSTGWADQAGSPRWCGPHNVASSEAAVGRR